MPSLTHYSTQPRFTLPGSQKEPLNEGTLVSPPSGLSTPAVTALRGAAAIGPAKPARGSLTVSVVVRRKQPLDSAKLGKPGGRMTHTEYARSHGPAPESIAAVTAFAKEFGLRAKPPSPGRRAVQVSGPVGAMQKAFGVVLSSMQVGARTYRVREGAISLPRGLYGHVEAVLGLDNRPQAEPHFRCSRAASEAAEGATEPAAATTRATADRTFTPPQVSQLYDFPAGVKAAGQAIALVELDGGFRPADVSAYFKSLALPAPKIVVVGFDGAKNAPTGDPNGPDGEVLLDIEVAASVAPGATIVVYFAPNTDKGFLDAIATAVHDTKNKPGVISISWGAAESRWTPQSMTALDEACQTAAALGVTITVASGDNGSSDSVSDGKNHADFPASSPHVLGCGGTKLIASATSIESEVVWNEGSDGATGGGVSNFFPLPTWQQKVGVPKPSVATGGRGVPDVSGDADPATGYKALVDGKSMVIGGTSAVAPLWAGLITLCNAQNKSTAGFINPLLYAAAAGKSLRDIVEGNNGAFKAKKGWDACSGLGSPIGTRIASTLQGSSATPSGKSPGKSAKNKKPAKSAKRVSSTKR